MKQFESVDIGLLRKYSGPGPRYTSYPTAPVFTPEFGPREYSQAIEETNHAENTSPLSLYFHFPYCDTLCYFCGCTMLVTNHREQIREYNEYLKKEIEMIAPRIGRHRTVSQLHWGGGTPSYLDPDEIRDVGLFIRNRFRFDEDIEAGVEIDPRGLTIDHMKALKESGFNRVSMGVQDFNLKVQEAVNRVQPESITRDAINWSRDLGFHSVNLDLIYGLPYQTIDTFAETVDKVIDIAPDRLAVFNYAHVPWLKPHQKLILPETLPSLEQKLEIFKMTIEKLVAAGYWNVGMDHFAKQTDELAMAQKNRTLYRNFQGYSTKSGCDLYGFGMSAIGQFRDTYQQNQKTVRDYFKALDAGMIPTHLGYRMTADDHIRKDVIMKLMCDMELNKAEIERAHSIVFDEYFASSLPKLGQFIEDGLVTHTRDAIHVHGMGRIIIRNIAMCFDAYIDKLMAEKPIFSKTV
ncbi:MAG TPA: oxygen-independent coproporphyrinogen III oxidase [Bacteroidota bacterium]|nr:oxygen-independent coproporphyrinogen III oxidase [Bacteroidota bacterium]